MSEFDGSSDVLCHVPSASDIWILNYRTISVEVTVIISLIHMLVCIKDTVKHCRSFYLKINCRTMTSTK